MKELLQQEGAPSGDDEEKEDEDKDKEEGGDE